MRIVVKALCCAGLLVGMVSVAGAADQTWRGQISDSNCGASHAKMIAQHTAGANGAKMTGHDCAVACVKAGAKYVFVSGGKVYNISNQDFADLEKDAGHTVTLTGSMTGDTVTVAKLAMAPAKKPATAPAS